MEKFDTEVGVSFSSSKRTSRSCICLVILSGAVVLLVTISAIFVTLYVMEKRSPAALSAATTSTENLSTNHRTTVTPPTTEKQSATTVTYLPTTQKAREQKYCGSKTCLLASLGKLIFPPGLVKVYTV